jgi:CheY-like chemotaxis protein
MPPRKLVVLVVEDDPALQKLIVTYLAQGGYEVIPSGDGQAALNQLASRRIDLVCLDLTLPRVSGYEVCETMRQDPRWANIPILIVSARALPEDRAYAEELGANGYLTKPFSRNDFNENVLRALEHRTRVAEAG